MSIRSTILACLTSLACIAMIIAYVSNRERYTLVNNQNALFVFDKKTATLNYCNEKNCQLITPQGTTIEAMRTMAGMPAQNSIITAQQQPQMVGFNNGGCPNGCAPDARLQKKPEANLTSLQTLNPTIGVGKAPATQGFNNVGMQNLISPANNISNPLPVQDNNSYSMSVNTGSFQNTGYAPAPSSPNPQENSYGNAVASSAAQANPYGSAVTPGASDPSATNNAASNTAANIYGVSPTVATTAPASTPYPMSY